MIERALPRTRRPAAALAAVLLALTLSACGQQAKVAELEEKVLRAEAAAQKAVAAQQAAESAVARIRRAENNDRRGEGEDEASNYQETGPQPQGDGGGDEPNGDQPEIAAAPEA